MDKQNIEMIIRDLFRANFHHYRSDYSKEVLHSPSEIAADWAVNLFDNRNDQEQLRDEQLLITVENYKSWAVAELKSLQQDA